MADAEDWKAKEKKWEKGCVPTDTMSNDQLEEYIKLKLHQYTEYNVSDKNLFKVYQEDFKDFKVNDFRRLNTLVL